LVTVRSFVINGNGAAAFSADGTANGIYTGSGGSITTVAADDATHFILTGFNDSGTVVMREVVPSLPPREELRSWSGP
jgi:hypothetical protein